ncbi:phosphonate ABC transporter ATP-binding protein [Terasakiella sp. A23]|uniref:phosphonate ABC transporter ATP-binding protein n=1 Tax=Terasakiella sp. FCG-A23 TaxID=3080561 RepID=UPI002954C7E7|nr:phosphonate ABC transporter ATP-binding protein [Terasakiella sp. A23]MDV7340339.1 phosphonate ABC transporter ATP-binding protein [Terasakiella sp. A23]
MSAINVKELHKTFGKNKALNSVSLNIEPGEMVALIGASGSGKSTLIRHIAGLVYGDRGCCEISVLGQTMQKNGKQGRGIRKIRSQIGVVFQQFNLVNRLSVLTNVLMGYLGQIPSWRGSLGLFTQEEKQRAMEALQRVGIDHLATQRSSTLSGGQQQRAAIARTITQGAEVILADEPIASLDPASSRKVMDTLQRVNQEDQVTVLVSLHQVDYALQYCPRTIAMRDGQIVFDGASEQLTPEFLKQLYGDHTLELYGNDKQEEPAKDYFPEGAVALATA